MSYFATAPHEKERLQYFASPEGRDDLYQYNQKERRTVLEVISSEYNNWSIALRTDEQLKLFINPSLFIKQTKVEQRFRIVY